MIRSVGTLYAIQDLFDHLEQHLIAKDEFLAGFSKYGTSTALDVYDTASELSWICTADSGQLVLTLIGKDANQGIDRPSKLRCQLAKIIEANHPTWAALLPKGRKEAVAGFPEEIRQCFDEALLLGEISEEVVSWWAQSSSVMRAIAQRMRVATGVCAAKEKASSTSINARDTCHVGKVLKRAMQVTTSCLYAITSIKKPSKSR